MKRTRVFFSALLAFSAIPFLASAAPVVSNVDFVQRPDGSGSTQVVVTYDLVSPNGNAAVSLLYSTDGGTSFSAATTTTGDVGAGLTPGTGKTIDWAVAIDLPDQQITGNFIVRVVAEDGIAIPLAITSNAPADVHQLETQTLTFTFAEAVTGFNVTDVVVIGGTKGAFAGSGAVYTLEVTGTGGVVTVSVAADAASSMASGTTTLGNSFTNFYQDTWTVNLPGDVPMELIRIPAGTFMMGSPETELSRGSNETQHEVTISEDFYLGKTEVTQAQWLAIYGSFPLAQSHGTNDNLAVHRVSYNDIMDASTGFMKLLNDHVTEPGTFSLPTEAQWEYAARAGTTTRFNFGDGTSTDEFCSLGGGREDNMWFCGNSNSLTQLVGQKPANAWGLFDMHGNVWEWCRDWFGNYPTGPVTDPTGPASGSDRVMRGGSWGNIARNCRSALRNLSTPANRNNGVGFRVFAVR